MPTLVPSPSVAVVGAGIAGTACAAALRQAGLRVTLFEKSAAVGGRMATMPATWTGDDGAALGGEFDIGAQLIGARHARFRARLALAEAAGVVAAWRPRVHAAWPATPVRECWVGVPGMPALTRHLAQGVPQRLSTTVQRLHRTGDGWQLVLSGGATSGPYDQVVLALPPAQAAVLLAGHADAWADELAAVPMQACWALMAVTDDVDWPWDAVEPDRGPLAWVARNDRKPGRLATPGLAAWVALATPPWSAAQLEAEPAAVAGALREALTALLPYSRPGAPALRWHHAAVHRWRDAVPARGLAGSGDCRWDAALGLGLCGDIFGGGDVEGAWRSGDELADTLIAGLDARTAPTETAEMS